MGQADGLLYRIHKIQRYAVRVKGGQHEPRHIGNQAVYVGVVLWARKTLAPIGFGDSPDVRGMGLIRADQIGAVEAHSFAHPPIVFPYRFFPVATGEAYVHGTADALANAAQTGGKGVSNDAGFLQKGKL